MKTIRPRTWRRVVIAPVLLLLSLVICSSRVSAQESRTACPTGATTFSLQYGDYVLCTLTANTPHRWQFQAAANEFVAFQLVRTLGTGTPCIAIENASGATIFTRYCATVITAPGDRPTIQIPAGGTYTLVVTESGNTFQSYQYSLILERVSPPTNLVPLIAPAETIRGSINPVGDRDLVQFRVQAGDRYSFQLDRLAGTGSPIMYVIDNLGASRRVNSRAEVTALTSGTFVLWIADGSDNQIFDYDLLFSCKGTCPAPPPVISRAANSANATAQVCPGTFTSIYGQWLGTMARLWEGRDFTGNAMPTSLEGSAVTFGDQKAYAYYVSPVQMNVIVPRLAPGNYPVRVTTSAGQSNSIDVDIKEICPAAFMYGDQRYVVAIYPDRTPAATPSVPGRAAKPGDVLMLFTSGLGRTAPDYPEGELVPNPLATAMPVRVSVGGVGAEVLYSGLVAPGLYQLNIRIPGVPAGEQRLRIEVGNTSSPEGVSIFIGQN